MPTTARRLMPALGIITLTNGQLVMRRELKEMDHRGTSRHYRPGTQGEAALCNHYRRRSAAGARGHQLSPLIVC